MPYLSHIFVLPREFDAKSHDCWNIFPQISHLNYPICFSWTAWSWFFKDAFTIKYAPHLSHLKGRSPEWVRRCRFKLVELFNLFPQISHLDLPFMNCLLMCSQIRVFLLKAAPHLKGLSPEWILKWPERWAFWLVSYFSFRISLLVPKQAFGITPNLTLPLLPTTLSESYLAHVWRRSTTITTQTTTRTTTPKSLRKP